MRLPGNRKYRLIVSTGLIVTLIGLSRVAVPVHWFTPQYPWTPVVEPQLPDVLLIGDSTEMRYAPYVLSALDGVANVYSLWEHDSQRLHSLFIGGPLIRPVNAASTHYGLGQLDEWLDGKTWDVIHFNWGYPRPAFTGARRTRSQATRTAGFGIRFPSRRPGYQTD